MTFSANTLNPIAELLLDRLQVTSADIAHHVGVSLRTAEDRLKELQRQGRAHRVRQIVPLSPTGQVWAPGRLPKEDGRPVFEPLHLTVSTWSAPRFRIGAVEAYFFGRVPAPSLLGSSMDMVAA